MDRIDPEPEQPPRQQCLITSIGATDLILESQTCDW